MDKDKQIQKVDKLSLKKLSEDSSLAKRGLRDIGIWPKIQTLLKEIEAQFFAHNYQKCIELCDEALASEPVLYVPLCFKALCFVRLEKYEEAINWFDKALQTELPLETTPLEQKYEKDKPVYTKPDFEIAIGNKGFCLLKLGKYEEAIPYLDQALKINPQNYINLTNKAFCLSELGKNDEALIFYEKALVLQPIADKYYDFKGTLNDYYQLLRKTPESELLTKIDNFYYENEKDIAFLLWQAYLDDNKENLKTLIQRARDKFKQNEYFYSIDLFSICIKRDGTLFYSWQFRGDCYWKLNDYKNALSDYLKSIELDPTNGAAYDNAAMCFFNIGDYDKAHSYIDRAIEIEGENDMPMVRKAQFFEFQQRKTEALNQYKKTLEKFPNSEYAQKKILELTK